VKHYIGDVIYYVYSSTHYSKRIPCPVCYGKRSVKIIFGNGEEHDTICGYCSHGIESATGVATTWEPFAEVRSGEITGVAVLNGIITYQIGHSNFAESDVYSTREAADLVCVETFEKCKKQSEVWFRDSFIQCKKNQTWSAGYHKSSIADAQRRIEWHKSRLDMIAEKKKEVLD
jgi:hypothetical protein